METNIQVGEEYLKKLETIRKGRFIRVDDFSKRYSTIDIVIILEKNLWDRL